MKKRPFLTVVPRAIQLWALAIVACAVAIGLIVGQQTADPQAILRTMAMYGAAALGAGILLATWLLCVGFVFADARQRAMRPVAWVLVAILVPHLLGFLLYFVMRQPLACFCTHCGQTVAVNQRFCPSCGSSQIDSASSRAADEPIPAENHGA